MTALAFGIVSTMISHRYEIVGSPDVHGVPQEFFVQTAVAFRSEIDLDRRNSVFWRSRDDFGLYFFEVMRRAL